MMAADLFSYFLTIFVLVIIPGPVVLLLLVRTVSNDLSGALFFGAGYTLGGMLIIPVVCFGLSAWLTAVPAIFEYSKYVMLAYILWLAHSISKGGFDLSGDCKVARSNRGKSVLAGFMTCAISPYMMILLPLTVPEMLNIDTIVMPDFLIIVMTTFFAFMLGVGLTIGFAAQIRKLARTPKSIRILNRSLSALLVLGGGFLALS